MITRTGEALADPVGRLLLAFESIGRKSDLAPEACDKGWPGFCFDSRVEG
jgi:hypothetical protein